MRYMFIDGTNKHPPFLEMNLSSTKCDVKSMEEINYHHGKIMKRRLTKFIFETESTQSKLSRLRIMSLSLENDVKKIIQANLQKKKVDN